MLLVRLRHHAVDFCEDPADAARDTRHNRTRGDGHKAGHESVLDQILTFGVLPDPQAPNHFANILHLVLSLASIVCVAVPKVTLPWFTRNQTNT